MCSIMGVFNTSVRELDSERLRECFDRSELRGPDAADSASGDGYWLGFRRLAIMGLSDAGMQPFELGSRLLVCNGEIYGFRELKKGLEGKYTFRSDSDCELLLPLFQEKGIEMLKELDAEFALLMYDKDSGEYLAARDPIGIRPLFWGRTIDGGKAFASEARCLLGLCEDIRPFPPGCCYYQGRLLRYCDIAQTESFVSGELDEICGCIREKLIDGVVKRLDSDAPLGFLLSGGLDSSLVCAIAARSMKKPIRTFAIGMKKDAIDLKYAKEVADYIGSDHTEVIIEFSDVIEALDTVVSILGTYDITTIRASLGMYLLCREIHRTTDIKVLLTGEISDEIFGYKYTDFAPSAAEFQREAQKRLRELYMYDVLRADRCISDNSIEARVPFGDLAFVRYVMSIAPEMKLNTYGMGKYLLRHAFEGQGLLPDSILFREKAAFSDAVGHSMVDMLKAYAENKYTDEEFRRLSGRYGFAAPFTKEALLYRELFEKHYPRQAEMVTDFWMPNPRWSGCNVSDPSARVLSNYGKSGQ